jgi:hypothetical protein
MGGAYIKPLSIREEFMLGRKGSAAAEQHPISVPTIPAFQASTGSSANMNAAQAKPMPRNKLVHSNPLFGPSYLILTSFLVWYRSTSTSELRWFVREESGSAAHTLILPKHLLGYAKE